MRIINKSDGSTKIIRTTKVTGKVQIYFIKKKFAVRMSYLNEQRCTALSALTCRANTDKAFIEVIHIYELLNYVSGLRDLF